MGVLESALKMAGLALGEAEQPGWKKIVPAMDLPSIAQAGQPMQRPTEAVTQVFVLQHTEPSRVVQVIRPFLTQPGANTVELAEHRTLVITDFASNMQRLAKLVALVDQPRPEVVLQLVSVENVAAEDLAQQVAKLAASKARAKGVTDLASAVEVTHDARTNQLVLVGPEPQVREASDIARSLDTPLGLETRVYTLKLVSAERVDKLAKEMIGPVAAGRLYRSSIDKEGNLLVVSTTPRLHEQVQALQQQLDVPIAEAESPIRFYKLYNAPAADVLATISALEGGEELTSMQLPELEGGAAEPSASAPEQAMAGTPTGAATQPVGKTNQSPYLGQTSPPSVNGAVQDYGAPVRSHGPRSVRTPRAMVAADANTNSLIVVAEPAVQQLYEQLIAKLDKRRPQVVIEATIVTLDTSNGFSLGVEISAGDREGDNKYISLSSFGLSDIDDNGRLLLTPGLGFNGAVLTSDVADVILRALSTSSRARVRSAPKILVNDNATGTLASVNEAPFTSINASDTVSTTSFAGYATAGTTITMTPHIAEGDHLHLEYAVTLSSFTGKGTQDVPPPRRTNTLQSQVTVPDGYTVVVGGLNREDDSKTLDRVPFLGEIPLVEYLFSNRTSTDSQSTLFVFLRPVILRDDQFADLKYLSGVDMQVMGLARDLPESEPMAVY